MKAMILAAGFGTRLRPYSLVRPKPLFPILNKSLLKLSIDRLREAGFQEIVVNSHHLGQQIKKVLEKETGIILQEEPDILGTGGGMAKALSGLGAEPVLVTNGDICHTLDHAAIFAWHRNSGAPITLVLHNVPRYNNVSIGEDGRILGFGQASSGNQRVEATLAFTGIHVLQPEMLKGLPTSTFSNIIDHYRQLIKSGVPVKALVKEGHYWTDIGTPADYLMLHEQVLTGQVIIPGLPQPHNPLWLAEDCALPQDTQLSDWVCLGPRVRVGGRVSLRKVVVWEGAVIPDDAQVFQTIVSA